jgi:hypothetical protein
VTAFEMYVAPRDLDEHDCPSPASHLPAGRVKVQGLGFGVRV